MSAVDAKNLVIRLKDDEAFRKTIRSLDYTQAWEMVKQEGFDCSEEEIKKAYDNFGCGIMGPRSAWREAIKKLCSLPLTYPGVNLNRNVLE